MYRKKQGQSKVESSRRTHREKQLGSRSARQFVHVGQKKLLYRLFGCLRQPARGSCGPSVCAWSALLCLAISIEIREKSKQANANADGANSQGARRVFAAPIIQIGSEQITSSASSSSVFVLMSLFAPFVSLIAFQTFFF